MSDEPKQPPPVNLPPWLKKSAAKLAGQATSAIANVVKQPPAMPSIVQQVGKELGAKIVDKALSAYDKDMALERRATGISTAEALQNRSARAQENAQVQWASRQEQIELRQFVDREAQLRGQGIDALRAEAAALTDKFGMTEAWASRPLSREARENRLMQRNAKIESYMQVLTGNQSQPEGGERLGGVYGNANPADGTEVRGALENKSGGFNPQFED